MRFFRWFGNVWNDLVVGQLQIIHQEKDESSLKTIRGSSIFIMVWMAVVLTVIEYYGNSGSIFYKWFYAALPKESPYSTIYRHAYWSLSTAACYWFLPAFAIFFTRGKTVKDYGLETKGFTEHIWIYVLLFMVVLPAVIFVSYTKSFQHTYPFYRNASDSWNHLALWWLVYGVQFFSLEFFFRGYVLHGLKKDIGVYAIFFSTVPYCMIHYGKPLPETIGSIIAGVALGILSMRTLSVWSGFLIHISVAFCMDTLSMWQKGKFSLFM